MVYGTSTLHPLARTVIYVELSSVVCILHEDETALLSLSTSGRRGGEFIHGPSPPPKPGPGNNLGWSQTMVEPRYFDLLLIQFSLYGAPYFKVLTLA